MDRLPTHVWIQAQLWRLSAEGSLATVVRKGSAEAGTLVLKHRILGEGCRVYSQGRDARGRLGWVPGLNGALVSDTEADAFLTRQVSRDPDLWALEVETRSAENPLADTPFEWGGTS